MDPNKRTNWIKSERRAADRYGRFLHNSECPFSGRLACNCIYSRLFASIRGSLIRVNLRSSAVKGIFFAVTSAPETRGPSLWV
jgi:hypothetical protein